MENTDTGQLDDTDIDDVALLSLLLTLNRFHTCSGASNVDFEQVNAVWGTFGDLLLSLKTVL